MYWNNGQVIGGTVGDAFYTREPTDEELAYRPFGGLGGSLGVIYAGVYNADVKTAQQFINDLASKLNYETLAEDGKLGPKTCGAVEYFMTKLPQTEIAAALPEARALSEYIQSFPEIVDSCLRGVPAPWTYPKRLAPPPPPPPTAPPPEPELTPEQIKYLCTINAQQQGVLPTCDIPECYAINKGNCDAARAAAAAPAPTAQTLTPEQIRYLCMVTVQTEGAFAACQIPECRALDAGCEQILADGPRCFQMLADQGLVPTCRDPGCYRLNAPGCEAAFAAEAAAPPPPQQTQPGMTLMPGTTSCYRHSDGLETCDCYVYPGDKGPHIAHYQKALNKALVAAGYQQIPVSSVWDARTCGAQYVLAGSFRYDPATNPYCPRGEDFVYPGDCPEVIMPTRTEAPSLEPKKKMSKAAMFAIGGLALAAVGGGIYAATKGNAA